MVSVDENLQKIYDNCLTSLLELDYSTSIEEIKTELRKNIQNIELSYNLIKIDLKKSVM